MTTSSPNFTRQDAAISYIAFHGTKLVAKGSIEHVAAKSKQLLIRDNAASILVFNGLTAHQVEIDYRGTVQDVADRAKQREQRCSEQRSDGQEPTVEPSSRGRGRPKLGVIAREVTLLPRHWAWLKSQSGGASVTLRKLVEKARKEGDTQNQSRLAQDVTYRFMHAVGGDLPGFEEASRGLFGNNEDHFKTSINNWPSAIKKQCLRYAESAFPQSHQQ